MAYRIVVAGPALLCSMLVAAPALAEGPGGETSVAVDPVPAPAPESPPVVVSSAEIAPVAIDTPTTAAAPDIIEDHYEPYSDEPHDYIEPVEPYEPEPERRTTLKLDSGYFGMGIAPGMTLHHKGFHPNTRFELEFGGTLEHDYRDLALSFGVVTHITPYYERKAPSYGADVTMTALLGPVYLRTGLGALGGLPRQHLLHETTAGIGGVVGVGFSFGRQPMVRVGVDYDLRVNTKLEPVHTFLLAVRIACCRKD